MPQSLARVNANRFCSREHLNAARYQASLGRRKKTSDGYILVKEPSHPNAQPSTGWVLEHVKVVADLLGRKILPDEEVHHRNGVHDDNRLSNLELWPHSHPAGQTVPDLLAWAREIIARYEPIEHLLP